MSGGKKTRKSGASSGASGSFGGKRTNKVRVKAKAGRSESSRIWLQRQLNDPYVAAAKESGLRSRAAFKLMQLDEKFHLLRPGLRVLDLGAAPGGWTQVAVKAVGGQGRVVGLDLLPIDPIKGAILLELDFMAETAPGAIRSALNNLPVDLVLSDMAAGTTGHARTDHLRIMALAEAAHAFALEVLASGGAFVVKLFQGGAERELLTQLKRDFATVRHAKPAASRKESAESYLVAQNFRSKS